MKVEQTMNESTMFLDAVLGKSRLDNTENYQAMRDFLKLACETNLYMKKCGLDLEQYP